MDSNSHVLTVNILIIWKNVQVFRRQLSGQKVTPTEKHGAVRLERRQSNAAVRAAKVVNKKKARLTYPSC